MSIKAIACDLDGTLLLNGAQSLRPGTCELIHRLTESGVLFIAASGRQYANLRRLFAPVQDEIAYICENGCLTFYQGRLIDKELMERALGFSLLREILQTEGAEALLSGEDTSYIQRGQEAFYHHMKDVVKNNVTPVDDLFAVEEPFFKISLYERSGLRDVAYWQAKYGSRCTVATGGEQWLDMTPRGVTKETGFRKLMATLGIDLRDTMAIGDNDNDVEIMSACGYPVAMRSGKDSVKAIAREEIDIVEEFLEQLLRREKAIYRPCVPGRREG